MIKAWTQLDPFVQELVLCWHIVLLVTAQYRCLKHECVDAGKTTLLRDVTGLLAERFGRRVVVVDTSNEIGGDGKVPHSCIGRARRMPVQHKSKQHEVLQEAVQNHNPEVRWPRCNPVLQSLGKCSCSWFAVPWKYVFHRRWQVCHAHIVTW